MKSDNVHNKKDLKIDNRADVDRRRLEIRFSKKQKKARVARLAKNADFMEYIYELMVECEFFKSGEGKVNGECYEKKGKLIIANKIADDMTFLTDDGEGIQKIYKIRRECHVERINAELLKEGNN